MEREHTGVWRVGIVLCCSSFSPLVFQVLQEKGCRRKDSVTGKEDGKEKATESRRLWEGEERWQTPH